MVPVPILFSEQVFDRVSVCRDHIDGNVPLSALQLEYDPAEQCVTRGEVTRHGEYPYGEWIQPDEFPQWMNELATIVEEVYNNDQ